MLSQTARKFAEFLNIEEDAFKNSYEIRYSTFSSRIDPETGTKARNANCYQGGKLVAVYDGRTNEVYL